MRNFPSSADLSREQQAIYSEHLDKALLIIGPPGTGKTVMAIMRAQRMREQNNEAAKILMYNKTLKEFTNSQAKDIIVETMQSYLKKKFRLTNRDLTHTGKYEFPWINIYTTTKNHLDLDEIKKIFPRQVIIDEGQDFPTELWEILSEIWIKLRKENINFVPSVMADENQRLNQEANSNIDDIRNGLGLYADCFDSFKESSLTKNYRNTREIASFAKHFYVGNQTETPSSEDCRSGAKPILFFHKSSSLDVLTDRVLQYKINNPKKTIGILIAQNSSRNRVERLGLRLQAEVKKRELAINVQYYISRSKYPLKELNFDTTNTITVLTKQSSKGLEFDCVFVPSLNDIEYSDQGFLYAMDLYVVFHRARDHLFLGSNLSAKEIKDGDMKIPDILSKPLKVRDYKGDPLKIGFSNEAHLREYVDVEEGLIGTIKKEADISSILGNVASKNTSKKEQESKKEVSEKKKDDKSDIKKPDKDKEKEIINKVTNLINKLSYTKANIEILDKEMASLSLGDQNLIRARWQKISKSKKSKISIKKSNSTTPEENTGSIKIELNIVSGNKSDFIKIVTIIKKVLIDQNKDKIQIVSLKKDKNRIFKRFSRFLNQNLAGIANYVMPSPSNHMIIFKNKNKQKAIKIISADDEIRWRDKIIILGLEDLRHEDLDDSRIQKILLNISLRPSQVVNIIHPNTAEETPGVKYLNNKNDNGSLITKYDEL